MSMVIAVIPTQLPSQGIKTTQLVLPSVRKAVPGRGNQVFYFERKIMSGNIFVIIGPSGVGKDTLAKELFKEFKKLKYSVSVTTRSPRPLEKDGEDYYFVTDEDFDNFIKDDSFIEWCTVHGNRYGTLKRHINDTINSNEDILLILDIQGYKKLYKIFPEAIGIAILPPDYETLKERIISRGTESAEDLELRLKTAGLEMEAIVTNQVPIKYRIYNDDLEKAKIDIINKFNRLLPFDGEYIVG
jgi:guanylate kinase